MSEGMSQKVMESRLAEFVDRDREMSRFCEVLKTEDKPIMVVWGEGGIGKTSLLARMIHECSQRNLRKAEVVWNDSNPPDYMAVMRKIRDDVGVVDFTLFTDLINYYTNPGYRPIEINVALGGAVSVASGMQVSGSSVGDISGIVIKDNMIVVPRQDMDVPEAERRDKLTRRFIDGLKAAVESEPLIVFFDAVEKMSVDTERWVWGELLESVRCGSLRNVKFILCGRNPPPDDQDWLIFVEEAGLRPLRHKDIVKYLVKRVPDLGKEIESLNTVADLILANTEGNALRVVKEVKKILLMREKRTCGDE